MRTKRQRGQALVLIALAFVGLAAFIGLVIDAGILFTHIGHLRRAVDAASLAGASQYLADTTASELDATVKEFLQLNGIDPSLPMVSIKVCNLVGYEPDFAVYHDASLCKENNPWDYDRKLIRVEAELPVYFAFLPVIGFKSITITANSVSEAASVDLVLVLDTSTSMADDGPEEPGCNADDSCLPFKEVRASAREFVEQMAFPYDHVAIVNFDDDAWLAQPLTENEADVVAAIDSLIVAPMPGCPGPGPGGCLTTNIAGGLFRAQEAFFTNGREESLWVVVLLSDGAANQAWDPTFGDWICPNDLGLGYPDWVDPLCRDGDGDTRHTYGDSWYDADDAARDTSDVLGCYQLDNFDQSPYCAGMGIDGYEALLFTIGMGERIVAGDCDPYYASAGETCHPDLGERLLRYIAAVGDDGDPDSDLCAGVPQKVNCGNYYFAQTTADLGPVFTDIAKRVYTRITH
jgi:hypothetical protein